MRIKKKIKNQEIKPKTQRLFRPLNNMPFSIFFFIILSIFIFVYFNKSDDRLFYFAQKVDSFVNRIVEPFSNASDKITKAVQITKNKQELIQELNDLKDIILKYEDVLIEYNNLKEENEYLIAMLPLVKSINLKTITVIKRVDPAQPFVAVSSLPKNVLEEIYVGDVAISVNGLLGRVVSKNDTGIVVLLATNLLSRIPVISSKSNKKAILFGNNNDLFKIKYVSNSDDNLDSKAFLQNKKLNNEFLEGEMLMTDDSGGFFPKYIPVAKIEKDKDGNLVAKWICDQGHSFMTIVLKR